MLTYIPLRTMEIQIFYKSLLYIFLILIKYSTLVALFVLIVKLSLSSTLTFPFKYAFWC